jgi:hypothetical protein
MDGRSTGLRIFRIVLVCVLPALTTCGPHGDRKVSDLFERIECLEDSSASLTEGEARASRDWHACDGDRVDRGFTNSALWLRMSAAREVRTGIITFEWKVLGSLDLFVLEDGRVARHAVAASNASVRAGPWLTATTPPSRSRPCPTGPISSD